MIWTKYRIKTTTKDADMIAAILMDYDIVDIQIENNVQLSDEELNKLYAAFVTDMPEDDGISFINFFNEYEDTPENIAAQEELFRNVSEGLKEGCEMFGLEPVEFTSEVIDSADWENKWKAYFKPFFVEDIMIKPTWEEIPEGSEYSTLIEIDPGMAFGTGMHESTKLCLRGILNYMKPGDVVLDMGTGSGILSIAALKKGASCANAVDIDPKAVEVAEENFDVNGIDPSLYSLYVGNILQDENFKAEIAGKPADIVLANILADVIEPLVADVDKYMVPGGYFVSSGIIDNKEQLIVNAVNANPKLEFVGVEKDGDWRSVIARKK